MHCLKKKLYVCRLQHTVLYGQYNSHYHRLDCKASRMIIDGWALQTQSMEVFEKEMEDEERKGRKCGGGT